MERMAEIKKTKKYR